MLVPFGTIRCSSGMNTLFFGLREQAARGGVVWSAARKKRARASAGGAARHSLAAGYHVAEALARHDRAGGVGDDARDRGHHSTRRHVCVPRARASRNGVPPSVESNSARARGPRRTRDFLLDIDVPEVLGAQRLRAARHTLYAESRAERAAPRNRSGWRRRAAIATRTLVFALSCRRFFIIPRSSLT